MYRNTQGNDGLPADFAASGNDRPVEPAELLVAFGNGFQRGMRNGALVGGGMNHVAFAAAVAQEIPPEERESTAASMSVTTSLLAHMVSESRNPSSPHDALGPWLADAGGGVLGAVAAGAWPATLRTGVEFVASGIEALEDWARPKSFNEKMIEKFEGKNREKVVREGLEAFLDGVGTRSSRVPNVAEFMYDSENQKILMQFPNPTKRADYPKGSYELPYGPLPKETQDALVKWKAERDAGRAVELFDLRIENFRLGMIGHGMNLRSGRGATRMEIVPNTRKLSDREARHRDNRGGRG